MRKRSGTTENAMDALLDRWIGPAVDWIVGGLVAALVFLVGSGVLSRYIFNYSLAWSDELAGLGFVWLTLLGSIAAISTTIAAIDEKASGVTERVPSVPR